MKLNNGRHAVDTSQATVIATGETTKEGDGYGHETDKTFTLWKSQRSGKFFVTMHYQEYIAGCLRLLFRGRYRDQTVSGDMLINVYDTEEEMLQYVGRFGIRLPSSMLKPEEV